MCMLNYALCTANSSDPTNEYKDKAKNNAVGIRAQISLLPQPSTSPPSADRSHPRGLLGLSVCWSHAEALASAVTPASLTNPDP